MTSPTPTQISPYNLRDLDNALRRIAKFNGLILIPQEESAIGLPEATELNKNTFFLIREVAGTSPAILYVNLADGESTTGYSWVEIARGGSTGGGGMLKSSANGQFLLPAGPAQGTSVTSGQDAYGTYVEFEDSAPADFLVTKIIIAVSDPTVTYVQVQLGIGTSSSEASVWEDKGYPVRATATGVDGIAEIEIFPPVAVASGERLAVQLGDDVGSLTHYVTLGCINESDLVVI